MSTPEPIDWTKPASEILVDLLAIVEKRLPADKTRNDTAWVTLNRIPHVFDAATIKQMRESIVANGFGDFYQILVGGDDFGEPKVQAILDTLGTVDPAVFTTQRVATMKAWGVSRTPRWQSEGFESEPSLAQVNARKAAIYLAESQKNANQRIDEIKSIADAAAFTAQQDGGDGPAMITAWVAAVNNEVAGG